MSLKAKRRLKKIARARCPYPPRNSADLEMGQYVEWIRGFMGDEFLGYETTIAFDVYNEGAAAFKALTKP